MEENLICKGGGCTAKLGPDILSRVLKSLPKKHIDPNLLVGYDSSDDSSVYQLTEEIAIVQTLDFFPPMVKDPYVFGQIAAANALSDIYAMGGEVKTAQNIVCFPEHMDLNILGRIMEGGLNKVEEAGGLLSGGHSIFDSDVKYGLSVTGTVHPKKILLNIGGKSGDKLILTKKLGVGIISTADRVMEASEEGVKEAVNSMLQLNKYAAEISKNFQVHACTDVTGFGFLGHLHEMMGDSLQCEIHHEKIPYIKEAMHHGEEFLLTAAAQRNRNHLMNSVHFENIPFAMEELLFDPQTSGGLLFAVSDEDADKLEQALKAEGLVGEIVGEIIERDNSKSQITVI